MKVKAKVHPNSKNPRLEKSAEGLFEIYVKELALEGKANAAAIVALSRHFGLPKSAVRLAKGSRSKFKTFEIL